MDPHSSFRIGRLVVVGVGLIGGSFALALRRAGAVGRVVGVGRSPGNLEQALRLGIIDEIAGGLARALEGADLVLLAMPVGQTGAVLAQIEPHLGPAAVVSDAGSTKQDVTAAAREHFARALPRFVPAHPIAGAEGSGAGAASAELYRGRHVVLTPLPETDPRAVALVRQAWERCGARVSSMSPAEHDRVLGLVSHLPHVLAFALMDLVNRDGARERLLDYAGTGFRDFTRIAGSSPEMWRDVCLANRAALLDALDAYGKGLDSLRAAIEARDGAALMELFAAASRARREWGERGGNGAPEGGA
jgi:prephenate dehydrogenase